MNPEEFGFKSWKEMVIHNWDRLDIEQRFKLKQFGIYPKSEGGDNRNKKKEIENISLHNQ